MADYKKIRPVRYRSWLDSFPDEIYDLRDTSHIVRILDAMCGDPGVGGARKRMMLKRMQTQLSVTQMSDLDSLYGNVFNLPRLDREKYSYNADDLMTSDMIDDIRVKDAMYRARIWKYMRAFGYGGTAEGVRLAAESACGVPCQIVDMRKYKKSLAHGYSQEWLRANSAHNIGVDEDWTGCESVVIVMQDEPVEQNLLRMIYTAVIRIKPQDVVVTVRSRGEVYGQLGMSDVDDDEVDINAVAVSSSWWQIRKYVTGRPDWEYIKYPHSWIEPNVKKEAPRQILVNAQETSDDFTFMARNVVASSEHEGYYNVEQQSLFRSLVSDDARARMVAGNILSQASGMKYTASYYGDAFAIDWSYPTEYSPEIQSFFKEDARAVRWWSSDERFADDGTIEWVEFELKKSVPINRIELDVSRKPVRVVPYISSGFDKNGERVWVRLSSDDGLLLSYTSRLWGGSALTGEMCTVSFKFKTGVADAVRVEFERVNAPYLKDVGDGALEQVSFPYSIEAANLSVGYDVAKKSDFIASEFEDPFGNKVETAMSVYADTNMLDGSSSTYWLSQPNIGENAVEYLVLDVRRDGQPVKVNRIDIEAIYGGCQMNVYSDYALDDEGMPIEWSPYPEVFELNSGTFEIPARSVSFIKLEFTRLCAVPYTIAVKDAKVDSRLFPIDIRKHYDEQPSSTYEMQPGMWYYDDGASSYSYGDVYTDIGVQDIYQEANESKRSPWSVPTSVTMSQVTSSSSYSAFQNTSIGSSYGDDYAIEMRPLSIGGVTPIQSSNVFYRFWRNGEHQYSHRIDERMYELAYVVGIRSISVSHSASVAGVGIGEPFIMEMGDGRFIESANGWDISDGERMRVADDSRLNQLETVNINTIMPFRTFDFATNQNPPREVFEHVSDMREEWEGPKTERTEFGVSGSVLKMDAPAKNAGIRSEYKLVRTKAIASAQVEVFSQERGQFVFECTDLFGERIFSSEFETEPGKWNTLGAVFTPQPGGLWWNEDYNYRVALKVVGPSPSGASVFVPYVDFDALVEKGLLQQDHKDLKLIYFNGVECSEIDCDVTDNMELWFKLQEDVPKGDYTPSAYDYERDVFIGGYYLYFGFDQSKGSETSNPKRDYKNVFHPYKCTSNAVSEQDGWKVSANGKYFDLKDPYRIADEGFITFELTLDSDLEELADGSTGTPDVRFIMDYDDGDKQFQVYTFERQLTVVIREKDGQGRYYESSYVSEYDQNNQIFASGVKSHVIIEWGKKGSAKVYRKGSHDPNDKHRRKITVWVDSVNPWPCINNVYDEVRYNEGVY